MKSDWTQNFANAGVSLVMLSELENLNHSYKNGEISPEAYEKRKTQLEESIKLTFYSISN